MTAESFSISETFCPLESVYAIANENNIWGNIQLSVKPNRIRWDFAQGTIHILRKHLCSTKFNSITKFYMKTGIFHQNKKVYFSKSCCDKIFMMFFEIFRTQRRKQTFKKFVKMLGLIKKVLT